MQDIILEEPYEFVPPVESDAWCWVLRFYLHRYLRTTFGVTEFECRGVERLKESLAKNAGIVLAANHSRLADPTAIGVLGGEAGCELFAMASWHLFKEGALQRFLIRRMGAFSVYREGNDRHAVNYAIDILAENRRPLLIFPEGAVSRHNDLMMELMDGPGFLARQAAKKREKAGKGPVVIHPVALRYSFHGDVEATLSPEIEAFEKGFSWQPQTHLPIHKRLKQIGAALITLKELEYLGESQPGDPYERAERLIATMLDRLETKWNTNHRNGDAEAAGETDEQRAARVVSRVKRLRTVILPDLIEKRVTPEQRDERWRDLAVCYYLQQIAHYPRGYVTGEQDLPERLVETLERMIEDYRDEHSYHAPMRCTIQVGEAIEVTGKRDRSADGDPAMRETARQLQAMLDEMVAERRAELYG